ncbi:pentatricopeptide repeat-containing protein At5g06540-like isoform X1 [Rutidosis leptorrhynchoides]|uniref:pentatricopeptide repeat-containing protein At5g06540-like isoform X1 n=1 Tax=Rutidosis leptorrhynchoides TaxID=125765 RepID=UPI003A994CA7
MSNPKYLHLLKKCSTIDQLKQIHAQTVTVGLVRFKYITSKLLAFSTTFDINYAHKILNQITIPTIFDYNTIINGYSTTPKQKIGLVIYTQMCNNGIKPNNRTFPVLVQSSDCLHSLVQVHGQIVKIGYISDVYLTSALICMYSDYKVVELAKRVFEESCYKNVVCCTSLITGCFGNGRVDDARKVFDEMPERNDVSYSAMISGFVRNELFNEAIELFRGMKESGVKTNRSVLLSVVNACGAIGAFDVGRSIHCQLVEDDPFGFDLDIGTALIDFYSKCGEIEKAEDIFNRMSCKDVATWSAMILGLASNGKNEMAINLFNEMEQKGPVPNDITFVALLVSCNHKTLVKNAWRLLGKMWKVYNVRPVIEHYGCMVDLLARSGQLKGAEILIKLMPMAPDGAIWGSFLHGCLIHNEMGLAERTGKYLVELDPKHSGLYVMLSNMYANMRSWNDVSRLRNMMLERKVATTAGWSFIEIDGIVHKFVVNGHTGCHQVRDFYKVLQLLHNVLMNELV